MFTTLLKKGCTVNPAATFARTSHFYKVNTMTQMRWTAMRSFSAPPQAPVPQSTESDDLSNRETISLEEFYSSVSDYSLSDDKALEYMHFAAKLAVISFKDENEMLQFKGDFQAALAFIGKLDEVDVSLFRVG